MSEMKMEIKNIAIIRGNSAKVKDGRIIYTPSQIESEHKDRQNRDGRKLIDRVALRSDVHFSNGELGFTLKCQSHETSVLAVFYSTEGREIICGYYNGWKAFVIARQTEDGQWKPLSFAGKLEDYELGAEIKFQITINGSQINLLIDNIHLCSATTAVKNSPIEFLIESTGEFEISDITMHGPKRSAFVVMQFSEEYDELYEDVIKPVTEKFGYECVRADKLYTSTPILNDIIQSIKDSSMVIAEITPDNPNVFYEIGFSHAIGTPTILLCDKKREKLPFDISSFRTLFYENTIAGKKNVENNLMKYLERIQLQQQEFDGNALGRLKVPL